MKSVHKALFWVLFSLHFKIALFSKISTALYKPAIVETEDLQYLVVIGTVDGNIHAIDELLQKRWTTSTGSPLTFSATSTQNSAEESESFPSGSDNARKINSILPTLDGSLMFYTNEGMKRTPLKAKSMANMSPYISQEQMLFTGNRNSRLISVNMKDGSILQDIGHTANLFEARTLPGKEGLHPKPPLKKTASAEIKTVYPFWFGRIDYTLQAIDMLSGQSSPPSGGASEYHIRYSEVYPLHTQSLPPTTSSSSHHTSIFDSDLQLYSTPEGYLYMFDASGNLLHQDPIALSSPAVDAYLVRLSAQEKTSSFIGHLPIEYGLNGLRFYHQMKMKQKHQGGGAGGDTEEEVTSEHLQSQNLALQAVGSATTPSTFPPTKGVPANHDEDEEEEEEEEEEAEVEQEEGGRKGGRPSGSNGDPQSGAGDEKMVLVQSITHEISQQEHLYAMELSLSEEMMDYLYDSYQQETSSSEATPGLIGGLPKVPRLSAPPIDDSEYNETAPTALLTFPQQQRTEERITTGTVSEDLFTQEVPGRLPWSSTNTEASMNTDVVFPTSLTPKDDNDSTPIDPTDPTPSASVTSSAVTPSKGSKLGKKPFVRKPTKPGTGNTPIQQSLQAFEDSFAAHLHYRNLPRDRGSASSDNKGDILSPIRGGDDEEIVVLGDYHQEEEGEVGEKEREEGEGSLRAIASDSLDLQGSRAPLVQYTSSQHTIHSIHRLIPGYVDEAYLVPHLFPTKQEPSLDQLLPQGPSTTIPSPPQPTPPSGLVWYMILALILGILSTSVAGYFVYSYRLLGIQSTTSSSSTATTTSSTVIVPDPPKLPDEDAYGKILTRVGAMIVYNKILGYGSYGTIVYLGTLHGRFVAVKRLLSQLHKIADREISLLIKSDGHPNVLRYYSKEHQEDFIYLGLQLSVMSLRDFIGKLQYHQQTSSANPATENETANVPDVQKALSELLTEDDFRNIFLQMAEGVNYLHRQKIVHRDIKPHNILCVLPTDQYATTTPAAAANTSSLPAEDGTTPAVERKLPFPITLQDHPAGSITSVTQLSSFVLKISDMGLSKALEDGHGLDGQSTGSLASMASMHWKKSQILSGTSLDDSTQQKKAESLILADYDVGTSGWQAPELLKARQTRQQARYATATTAASTVAVKTEGESEEVNTGTGDDPVAASIALILKSDIFSLGCVFYYILSQGDHPFGDPFDREHNILSSSHLPGLSALQGCPEGIDLLQGMLAKDPVSRLTSQQVLAHPFFWSNAKRLEYLLELSDRLEQESTTANSASFANNTFNPVLFQVESMSSSIFATTSKRWDRAIDQALLEDSGKYRKYDPCSLRDFLRLIRNKRHHYYELSGPLKAVLGGLPNGFYLYFATRFPLLLLQCLKIGLTFYAKEPHFVPYLQDVVLGGGPIATAATATTTVATVTATVAVDSVCSDPIIPSPLSPVASKKEEVEMMKDGPLVVGGDTVGRLQSPPPKLPAPVLSPPLSPIPAPTAPVPATVAPANATSSAATTAVIQPDVIVWHQSALHQSLLPYNVRFGWYRDTLDWIGPLGTSSSLSSKKTPKSSHLLKALQDPKYRTRLCSHWEATDGQVCPMRKKGKCIFAHGPLELRCKESRRDKWGRGGGGAETGAALSLFASGGEDAISAARVLEKGRVDSGNNNLTTNSNPTPSHMMMNGQPGAVDMMDYQHQRMYYPQTGAAGTGYYPYYPANAPAPPTYGPSGEYDPQQSFGVYHPHHQTNNSSTGHPSDSSMQYYGSLNTQQYSHHHNQH